MTYSISKTESGEAGAMDTHQELEALKRHYRERGNQVIKDLDALTNVIFVEHPNFDHTPAEKVSVKIISTGVFPLSVDCEIVLDIEQYREDSDRFLVVHEIFLIYYLAQRTYSMEIAIEVLPLHNTRLDHVFRKYTIDQLLSTL